MSCYLARQELSACPGEEQWGIREAQIRQLRPGQMSVIVVKGPGYSADDEAALGREAARFVGNEIEFEIEYAEGLPRTSAGKLRFVVSSVGGAQNAASDPEEADA